MGRNWIGDTYGKADCLDEKVSMKPMLAKMIDEAFRIAVADSLDVPAKRKLAIFRDLYEITPKEWSSIDPGAIRQNLACRLLGFGGWSIRGVYSGNATARQVFDATMANADQSDMDNFVGELGLTEAD